MAQCTYVIDGGELGDIELDVHYLYSPGTSDVMYMPNGDPGYPGDPAELEVIHVYMAEGGKNVDDMYLDFLQYSDRFHEFIGELEAERNRGDAEDYAYEMERDRQLWEKAA